MTLENIIKQIDASYTKEMLSNYWLPPITIFIVAAVNKGSKKEAIQFLYKAITQKKAHSKADLVDICARFYADPELVHDYYQTLSSADKQLIEIATWLTTVPYTTLKLIFGDHVVQVERFKHAQVSAQPFFKQWMPFLKVQNSWYNLHLSVDQWVEYLHPYFQFPPFLKEAYGQLLEKPKDYTLNPLEIKPNWSTYSGEAAIFEELPLVFTLYQQQKLKYTQSGHVNLASAKRMQGSLKMASFPNDDGYIKGTLIASMLGRYYDPPTNAPVLKALQSLVDSDLNTERMLMAVLFPFTGIRKLYDHYLNMNAMLAVQDLFALFKPEAWISQQNILLFAEYHQIDIHPVHPDSLSLLLLDPTSKAYPAYSESNKWEKLATVTGYFVNGLILAYASLGLMELAYDPKDPNEDNGFGHFTACRLTLLGRHVLGMEENYTPPKAVKGIQFELDANSLMIHSEGNQGVAEAVLKKYATKVSEGSFLFDTAKFLKNCDDTSDIKEEMASFQQIFDQKMPRNWMELFKTLIQKGRAIKECNDYKVLQISAQEKDLRSIIAHDAALRSYVIKAENFHIIIKGKDYGRFLVRMGELGYLVTGEGDGFDEDEDDNDF